MIVYWWGHCPTIHVYWLEFDYAKFLDAFEVESGGRG